MGPHYMDTQRMNGQQQGMEVSCLSLTNLRGEQVRACAHVCLFPLSSVTHFIEVFSEWDFCGS